jgi:RNA-directed DNA polymerase
VLERGSGGEILAEGLRARRERVSRKRGHLLGKRHLYGAGGKAGTCTARSGWGARHLFRQIVSYADDFVILCASWRQAEESLSQVSRWLEKLGLTIHPTKTRLCYAREESFDFLGYTFGPARHWQSGKRFIASLPSKKSQKRLKEKINTLLHRGNPTPWPELQARLNRLLSGWAEYFSFGHTGQADEAIGWHVRARVRRFLCRRHKLRVSGTSRFGYAEVHEKMGVVDLHQRRLQRRPVHALS